MLGLSNAPAFVVSGSGGLVDLFMLGVNNSPRLPRGRFRVGLVDLFLPGLNNSPRPRPLAGG